MKSLNLAQFLATVVLVLAVALTAPMPEGLERAEAAVSGRKVRAIERKTLRCINRQRTRAGLSPVGFGRSLTTAARYHSRNMARFGFFDHSDPWGRQSWDRVALFDSRQWSVGENIGAGYNHSGAVCRGWMESTGHRDNILDPIWTYGGIGYARTRRGYRDYWTLVMGSLPAPPDPPAE